MLARVSLALLFPLAACGGSSSSSSPDAAPMADAGPPSVRAVTCPPGAVPTVSSSDANDISYMPSSVTVSVGGIVKFMMSSFHNVAPNPLKSTDAGLKVDFGATACLEFDKAGTLSFMCASHGFTGTVVVQ